MMKLVIHSFLVQKRNVMFWINLFVIVALSVEMIVHISLHPDEEFVSYMAMWSWIFISPLVDHDAIGNKIYAYMPLDLKDKKKIFISRLFCWIGFLMGMEFLIYLLMILVHPAAIQILFYANGYNPIVMVLLFLHMLVTKIYRTDCVIVSKRVYYSNVISVIMSFVLLSFPNCRLGETPGFWIYLAFFLVILFLSGFTIYFAYVDYIPKDSLNTDKPGSLKKH